jgi:hypothetical protein
MEIKQSFDILYDKPSVFRVHKQVTRASQK